MAISLEDFEKGELININGIFSYKYFGRQYNRAASVNSFCMNIFLSALRQLTETKIILIVG